MDLGFLIDGSGSIEHYGRGNFKRCLRFVVRMVNAFKISAKFTRIGVVVYSSRPRLIMRFNRNGNKRHVLQVVRRIPYPRGGTKTGYALNYVKRYLFRGRSARKRVLIVMTDGKSQDRVYRPTLNLRRAGVQLYPIGIGRHYNSAQLRQMTPKKRNVFTAGFRNLASVVRGIKQNACKPKGKFPRMLLCNVSNTRTSV